MFVQSRLKRLTHSRILAFLPIHSEKSVVLSDNRVVYLSISVVNWLFVICTSFFIPHVWHRDAEGLIFYRCCFFFFSFFRRLISEVTERISTKLGHIIHLWLLFEKNWSALPRGRVFTPDDGLGQKRLFVTDFATEHDINNRKETYQSTCPQIWWTLVQK